MVLICHICKTNKNVHLRIGYALQRGIVACNTCHDNLLTKYIKEFSGSKDEYDEWIKLVIKERNKYNNFNNDTIICFVCKKGECQCETNNDQSNINKNLQFVQNPLPTAMPRIGYTFPHVSQYVNNNSFGFNLMNSGNTSTFLNNISQNMVNYSCPYPYPYQYPFVNQYGQIIGYSVYNNLKR